MIETKKLLPGVTLRSCRDDRFKQGCLSFQLVRPMAKEESAKNVLIPSVLLRGTKRCPDLRAITENLDELYGASVSPLVRRVGTTRPPAFTAALWTTGLPCPATGCLPLCSAFWRKSFWTSPRRGGLSPRLCGGEKKNLISTIDSELNDKRTYAMGKLLKTMCRGDSFGLPRLGEPEDVAAIDPAGLLTHYRKILRESRIEIFYVGSAPAEAVAEYISPLVSRLGGREGLLPPQTPFHACPGQDVTETMEVSQGKLCMGFATPIVNRDKEFPAMQVFNTVFGAGMTSKLFLNVREAMSLCYSIGSSYYGAKGILTVGAGIDFDKEQLTRDEILRQLDACRRGEITQEELTAGKEALLSSLRATSDSPGAIEGYYATAHLSGLNMTPERYMEVVEKVSLADVVAAARTVTLHSTYFLKGESQ